MSFHLIALAAILLGTGQADSQAPGATSAALACSDPELSALQPPAFIADSAPPAGPDGRLMPHNTGLPLGMGFLRSDPGEHYWEWHRHIRLPLFREPGEDMPFGWIADGWLIDMQNGSRRSFGTAGLVETEYESPSAIVYEIRATGWIRFRYLAEDNGTAWTHQCFFDLAEDPVSVTTWEERLTSDLISPLFFRREVPHALRAQPRAGSDRIAWIPANPAQYHLEPLEIRGDWMRVRVVAPSDYCSDPVDPTPTRSEGWVRWRDDEIGPWLWYYTRGC